MCLSGVCGEMVKKTVLDQFVKNKGYETVKRKRSGKWKNISEASKRTGLSRPTIYAILKDHPEPPDKTLPKYVEEFKDSEGYRLFKETFEKKLSKQTFEFHVSNLMLAWKKLDKKDPVSWNKKDYLKIWNIDKFIVEGVGFEEHYASSFHKIMELTDNHDLKHEFKGFKRPSGSKKHWFLHEAEIKATALCHIEADALLFEFAGIVWGARSKAMLGVIVKDIYFEDYTIQVYESKTKQFVSKYPPLALFRLLRRYIEDFNLQPEDRLFPRSYTFYNNALAAAGKCSKLKKRLSTHILKHTFVSQGHRHGLSRETVVDLTGTEDRTIKAYYLSLDEKKIRHETQGLERKEKPFWKWVEEDIAPAFEKRYNELMNQPQEPQVLAAPMTR